MDNYVRGNSVEEPLERKSIPIDCLPENFLWMKVKPGSKMKNVLGFASNAFKDEKVVLWTGSGPAMIKAISCAEIMKRKFKNLHQINRVCFRKREETWEPHKDNMDKLVVTREIPTIHIMLSKEPLDSSQIGYQGPDESNSSFKQNSSQGAKKKVPFRKGKPVTREQKEKYPAESSEQGKFSDETPPVEKIGSKKRKRKTDAGQKKE